MTATSTSTPIATSLRRRVLAAGSWSVLGFGFGQLVRLASNLIMTRILVPEMFGLMVVATVVMVGINMSFDLGLRQSVVRSIRGDDPRFLNTVWILQIGRGFVVAIIGVLISAAFLAATSLGLTPASTIYSDPLLPAVLLVLSIAAAVGGFESTKQLEASRNLQLRRLTQLELTTQIISLGVMFLWAFFDRSIWALVAGNLASTATRVALTHTLLRGTPNAWIWDRETFQEVIRLAKWIFPSSIAGFIANNADRLLVAVFVTPAVLGVYTIAFFVMNAIEQIFSRLTSEVLFPGLSEVARERPASLRAAYYKARIAIGIPTTLCSGLLVAGGQAVIDLLYDDRYSGAGWMLQILAVCLLAVQFQTATQSLVALGNVQPLLRIALTRAIAVLLLLPLGFSLHGLEGALWGFVLGYLSPVPVIYVYKAKAGLLIATKELIFIPIFVVGILGGALGLHLLRS